MDGLTPRQQQVLDFITYHIAEQGYPPTLREISRHLGTSGTVSALKHLEALERKGHIRKSAGSSRTIVLANASLSVSLPIVGTVRAGLPQLAYEEIEGYYLVDRAQLHGGTFFLRVKGNSMIGAGILEGDLALIRPQAMAENGDIIVAMVNSEATLKRFYRDRDHIRLQPANPDMEPILIHPGEEVSILGKVVKIVRDLE